jgi:hypothetical protein
MEDKAIEQGPRHSEPCEFCLEIGYLWFLQLG